MNDVPLVSIVMPSFNSERFIEVSINSVIYQDFRRWELLVIDGGSVDQTCNIVDVYVKSDSRIHLVNNVDDRGPAHARSIGVRKARGRYIAFLDCDDIWMANKLSTQIEFMQENDYNFTYTKYRVMNSEGTLASCSVKIPSCLGPSSYFFRRGIACSSVVVGRDLFTDEILNSYGPGLAEDTLWWLMIIESGNVAHGFKEVLLLYRDSIGSLSKRWSDNQTSVWRIYRNNFQLSFIFAVVAYVSYVADVILRRLSYKLCTKFWGFHSIEKN